MDENSEFLDEIPNVLYKYRVWNEPCTEHQYQRMILTHNEIYLASASRFNDPFDSSLPFRYKEQQLTPGNMYLKLRAIAEKFEPRPSDVEIEQMCYQQQNSGHFNPENYWKDFYPCFKANVYKTYGVLSLAKKPNNILMWSHYADSHKGLCVGFDKKLLFESIGGSIGPVIYSKKFPKIGLFDPAPVSILRLLNTKSKIWSYEKEFRFRKYGAANKVFNLPNEAIKEIVLGCNMDHKTKIEIHNLHDKKFKHAKIYEASINLNKYKVDLNEVYKFPKLS